MSRTDAGLPCLNCQEAIDPAQAKTFAGVLVCPGCYERAVRIENRLRSELERMLSLLREQIRMDLVQGKLHLGENRYEDISKKDLLESIVRLTDGKPTNHPKE